MSGSAFAAHPLPNLPRKGEGASTEFFAPAVPQLTSPLAGEAGRGVSQANTFLRETP